MKHSKLPQLSGSDLSITLIGALRAVGRSWLPDQSGWLRSCLDAARETLEKNHGIKTQKLFANEFVRNGFNYALLFIQSNSALLHISLNSPKSAEIYLKKILEDGRGGLTFEMCAEMAQVFSAVLDDHILKHQVKEACSRY